MTQKRRIWACLLQPTSRSMVTEMDRDDPLREFRDAFVIPAGHDLSRWQFAGLAAQGGGVRARARWSNRNGAARRFPAGTIITGSTCRSASARQIAPLIGAGRRRSGCRRHHLGQSVQSACGGAVAAARTPRHRDRAATTFRPISISRKGLPAFAASAASFVMSSRPRVADGAGRSGCGGELQPCQLRVAPDRGHGRHHRAGARGRRACGLGSVPQRGRDSGRAQRGAGRFRGRLRLQISEWRARARRPSCSPRAAIMRRCVSRCPDGWGTRRRSPSIIAIARRPAFAAC